MRQNFQTNFLMYKYQYELSLSAGLKLKNTKVYLFKKGLNIYFILEVEHQRARDGAEIEQEKKNRSSTCWFKPLMTTTGPRLKPGLQTRWKGFRYLAYLYPWLSSQAP